jgi:predicted DNA-binding transcriptional regulator YafY
MAKQDYIFRYLTIIKKLRRSKEATFREISDYLEEESDLAGRLFSVSMRTFQRDLNEIRELFRIDIQYDFSRKVYYIVEDLQSDLNNRMLESIDMINSLKVAEDLGRYMFFEKRKAGGTEHFHGLLNVIKNRVVISLLHRKYGNDEATERIVHPLALKESKGRWYLFARDTGDNRLKTFGLDRVVCFEETPRRFDYPANLDINEHFRHCFGVINPEDAEPQRIILSFDPEEGKYIKSYPFHESQEIITDNEKELRISLFLYITHDLVMELLSFGEHFTVVSPDRLKKSIVDVFQKGFERNGSPGV